MLANNASLYGENYHESNYITKYSKASTQDTLISLCGIDICKKNISSNTYEKQNYIQDKIKISPFVKWAGGKKQLLDVLCPKMPTAYETYYEPFIGGGSMFLHIQPKKAVINDINMQLINVYTQLKKDAFCVTECLDEFDRHVCDKDFYMKMREKYNNKIKNNLLDDECAALFIWINKHCFNGLYRVNSKGLFNVPFNNKSTGRSASKENLISIGTYLKNSDVEIRCGDFEDVFKNISKEDFVYFDSPYVPISDTASFTDYAKDGFEMKDHIRLANLYKKLSNLGVKSLLSNNDVKVIRELYKDFKIESVNVKRLINRDASKRKSKEVVISNF